MFNSIYERVGTKCPFFQWIDNPTCMRGTEATHLVQQKLDLLAHERKRAASQTAAEATQMAKIAQERAVKAIKRERKFRASSFKVKKIAVRALEQERVQNCTNSVSFYFYLFF